MNSLNKPKVVLDSNILISAILFRSRVGAVLDKAVFSCSMCFSHDLIREVEEKIVHKFNAGPEVLRQFNKTVSYGIVYAVSLYVDFPPDPRDGFLLALSETCQADYLVTGDGKHLRPLKQWKETKIISPREFMEIVKDPDGLPIEVYEE